MMTAASSLHFGGFLGRIVLVCHFVFLQKRTMVGIVDPLTNKKRSFAFTVMFDSCVL
jgi:hypothetical protein